MANAPVGTKNRPWRARISMRNGEASLSFSQGMPLVLLSTDPSAAITPITGAADALNHALFIGLSCENAHAPGQYGDVVIAGYHAAARVQRFTRTASSDIWLSFPAIAIGDYFTVDSVNNALVRSGPGAATADQAGIVALSAYVSHTSRASDYFSLTVPLTATALTQAIPVWLHNLG
jgi:hypothetical protein